MDNNTNRNEDRVTFTINEELGVLAEYDSGWTKELNLVSWNDRKPKFDVRDWKPGHDRMSKGVTLHPDEMQKLVESYRIFAETGGLDELAESTETPF